MITTQKQLGERIKALREDSGFSQEFVANYLNIPRPSVAQVESGKRSIDSFELKRLADLFGMEMPDFFAEKINESKKTVAHLRGSISENAKVAVNEVEKILNNYFFLLDLNQEKSEYFQYKHAELPLFKIKKGDYVALDRQATLLAASRRREMGIESAPIKDIFELLDHQNIFVIRKSYKDADFSGCLVYKPEKQLAAMIINANDNEFRQNFSAAHEYGHFLCHRDKAANAVFRDSGSFVVVDDQKEFKKKDPDERFVDLFAKSLLVPRASLESFLMQCCGEKVDMEAAVRAQIYFAVSKSCILNCLQNYGFISDYKRREFEKLQPEWRGIKRWLGYNYQAVKSESIQLPQRYKEMALRAYNNDQIGISKLAELLFMPVVETQDFLKKIKNADHCG